MKYDYEKATAQVTYFDSSDVITTSGGGYVCESHSNKAGVDCEYGLTRIVSNPCWNSAAM